MSKKDSWVQTLLFLFFIGAFFVLNLVLPDKDFSQQENRSLQTAPKFTFSDLFSGEFTTAYEDYVTDQFAFRNSWTALKARSELAIGKEANNGVYLCADEVLLEGFTAPEEETLTGSLDAINRLADNAESLGAEVYFALIPSASEIWQKKLPEGAPNDSQKDIIDFAYDYVKANNVDMYTVLSEHADENIFYRTDHHWTTLGAYYGYTAVMETMGIEPMALDAYEKTEVSDQFLGTTYSSSGFAWVEPESIHTYVQQGDVAITNYPQGMPEDSGLYVESYLDVKDKYSYFYGGNTPLLEIETGKTDAPSLLVVRDSYMDSMSPYFFEHFSKIAIFDLRYNKMSLKSYIEQNEIDKVLVCYSVPNFVTDMNIFLAGR